jgi:hypothetical protein
MIVGGLPCLTLVWCWFYFLVVPLNLAPTLVQVEAVSFLIASRLVSFHLNMTMDRNASAPTGHMWWYSPGLCRILSRNG